MKWVNHGYRKLTNYATKEKRYVAVFKLALNPLFRALRPTFRTATEALAYGKRIEDRITREGKG